jgi:hypothetical protein
MSNPYIDLSPADFLRAILKPAGEDAVAWTAIFSEPPTSDNKKGWIGKRCSVDDVPQINGCNAYYSVAAFPNSAPQRKIDWMLGVCVVLLDDIGTKALAESAVKLFGEPTFKMQTSPKSQQWGYALERPATNDEIAPVHSRLTELNMSDKNGLNAVRYGRLPAGVNNKTEYGEPFSVGCVEAHWDRVFKIEMFEAALESVPKSADTSLPHETKAEDGDEWEVLVARIISGTDYHGPLQVLSAKYAQRGYAAADVISILRGHMLSTADRSERWKDRFDDIERAVKTAMKFRPPEREDSIVLRQGALVENVDKTLEVLARRGVAASIFVRGGMLVRPYLAQRLGFKDEVVSSLEMASIDSTALGYELGGLIAFTRKSKEGHMKRVDCPPALPRTVLALPHRWTDLPRLDLIVSAPIYLGAGRLLSTPGYNKEKRAWLTVPAGVQCKERPTRADAVAALARLGLWIEEFPFAGEVDRAAMLAAMMMAALRPSLITCPGMVFDAPEFGSGKTTAAKLVHIIGFGRVPAVMNFVADPNEMRKLIDAAQIEGRQSLTFDNVPPNVIVTHDSLAQVLSEREREARELGSSRTHIVPCNQLIIVNGNNISVGDDLTRRMIGSRLDPVGDPTARRFKRPELLADVHKRRVSVLSDIFTIVAAYEAAGVIVTVDPLVGYDDWCRWVQQPLVWLGEADPVVSVRELQAEDEDRANLERVVELWHAVFGWEWVAAKTLCSHDNRLPDQKSLAELIELLRAAVGVDRDGRVDHQAMGYWLRRNKERWARSGMRIERKPSSEKSRSSAQWRVVARRGLQGNEGIPTASLESKTELNSISVQKPPSTPSDPLGYGPQEEM